MALDVYVGSLTRYYAGEWENISEKTARERGTQFRIGRRVGSGETDPDIQEILQAILTWRVELNQSLGDRVAQPLDWSEDLDAPYYTGRPGWDGFGSLVLWAAYAEHPAVRRPASLPEEWDNDPALVRSNVAGFRSRYSHLVRNVELWLPNPFEFTFEGEDVDGRRAASSRNSMPRPGRRTPISSPPGGAMPWPTTRRSSRTRAMPLPFCSISPSGRSSCACR